MKTACKPKFTFAALMASVLIATVSQASPPDSKPASEDAAETGLLAVTGNDVRPVQEAFDASFRSNL